MMAAVLESLIFLVMECSQLEYETFVLPHIRPLFCGPKTVQASVTLLEQLPVYIDKSGSCVLHHDILPMLYLALESSMSQVKENEKVILANILTSTNHFSVKLNPLLFMFHI